MEATEEPGAATEAPVAEQEVGVVALCDASALDAVAGAALWDALTAADAAVAGVSPTEEAEDGMEATEEPVTEEAGAVAPSEALSVVWPSEALDTACDDFAGAALTEEEEDGMEETEEPGAATEEPMPEEAAEPQVAAGEPVPTAGEPVEPCSLQTACEANAMTEQHVHGAQAPGAQPPDTVEAAKHRARVW